jgi:hypothetical protein
MIKTPEELQEQLYQERFDRLDEKLDDIKDLLGNKASSSSLLRLEQKVRTLEESHIPCATVMIVKKQLDDMEKEFRPIKEATDSAVYFAKHPKQLRLLILGALLLLIFSVVGLLPSWFMWRTYTLNVKKAQTEQLHNIPK